MSKIICDICGTTYPSSAENCPICGCSNAAAAELLAADPMSGEILDAGTDVVVDASVTNRKKEIFDFDEVNAEAVPAEEDSEEDYDEAEDYDAEEEEETPRHNTFTVILLTVLIVVLLGAAAFIFLRYFLPNMRDDGNEATTVAMQETEAVMDTEPTVPCQQMVMTNAGVAELNAEGQQFLLHIKALPENTTDKIVYTSGDESIATVTEDGKITAVSEGETVIYISCGKTSMECPVIVKYVEETVPPTTEPVVVETAPAETLAEPVEPQENANLKDVTLKLKKTDIQLGVYYQFQLVLDCDLTPEEVTWTSEHPHIATVDEKGNVTAVKAGTTSVTAKYGDQEVQCMVRCIWY